MVGHAKETLPERFRPCLQLNKEASSSPTPENRASGPQLILLGGGGGAGAHGVKNKLALVEYNAATCSLSDEVWDWQLEMPRWQQRET
jgi:hypothetical protein